jgi:hypothetical protein
VCAAGRLLIATSNLADTVRVSIKLLRR